VTKIIYLILINLVTPKARAKHEPYVQQTGLCLSQKIGSIEMSEGVEVLKDKFCQQKLFKDSDFTFQVFST
jgi:hypothetical protein